MSTQIPFDYILPFANQPAQTQKTSTFKLRTTLKTNKSQAWPIEAQQSSAHIIHTTIMYLNLSRVDIPEIFIFHKTTLKTSNSKAYTKVAQH